MLTVIGAWVLPCLCYLDAAPFRHAFDVTLRPFAARDHIDSFPLPDGHRFDRTSQTDLYRVKSSSADDTVGMLDSIEYKGLEEPYGASKARLI